MCLRRKEMNIGGGGAHRMIIVNSFRSKEDLCFTAGSDFRYNMANCDLRIQSFFQNLPYSAL